jgi:hypothetical protein
MLRAKCRLALFYQPNEGLLRVTHLPFLDGLWQAVIPFDFSPFLEALVSTRGYRAPCSPTRVYFFGSPSHYQALTDSHCESHPFIIHTAGNYIMYGLPDIGLVVRAR